MKIVEIETIFVDRFMFVRIHTDNGLTGLGESARAHMYHSSHFRGSAVMGAISAIDIALWDITG
jgi:galactonate dehydratase